MKQQTASFLAQPPQTLRIVYAQPHQLAAVHIISPQGIISYTSEGGEPRSKPAPEQDVAWYHHYE